MIKKIFYFVVLAFGLASLSLSAQNVNIPDPNFKAALVNHQANNGGGIYYKIDTNNDGEIQVSEAIAYSGNLRVFNKNISDFTGIEAFVNITYLECQNNKLTSLDLTANTNLKHIVCNGNQLTSLDVSNNPLLQTVHCYQNQLSNLDISNIPLLGNLNCADNKLSSLDLSDKPLLWSLNCNNNQLSSLDLGNKPELQNIYCWGNQLSDLDVSNFPKLVDLRCFFNQLSELDVTNNPALRHLYCYNNKLSNLDVSNNPLLESLECQSNQLSNLDVSNNPGLSWLRCSYNKLQSLDVSNNPALQRLECEGQSNKSLSSLNIGNKPVLLQLSCGNNSLSELDISNCPALRDLKCYYNELSSLDLSNKPNLRYLEIQNNKLSNLPDLSNLPILTWVRCGSNNLTSLVITNNPLLQEVQCNDNQLTSLDVSNNPALTYFSCSLNKLTSLDLSSLPALKSLFCHNNKLSSLDLSGNTALQSLSCSSNEFVSLDLSGNPFLTFINCGSNSLLTSLDLRNDFNANMTYIYADFNPRLGCILVDDAVYSNANWTGNQFRKNTFTCYAVSPCPTPVFDDWDTVCRGDILPTKSENDIKGTWSPVLTNIVGTYEYIFTPILGECANVLVKEITVTPKTEPYFDGLPPIQTICIGGTFPPLPEVSTNGIHGTWSPTQVNTQANIYTFTPNADQCANKLQITVKINPNAELNFSFPTAYCQGDTPPALPSTPDNMPAVTGVWSPATIDTSTAGTQTYTFTPNDANTCANTKQVQITITAQTDPQVQVNVSPNGQTVCGGTTFTFTAVPTNAGSNPNYQWYLNGSPVAGETNATFITNTLSHDDKVRVLLTPTDPCVMATPKLSNETTVSINQNLNPNVTLVAQGNITTICAGQNLKLIASGADTYTWTKDGTAISGTGNEQTITPPAGTHIYKVRGGVTNGCYSEKEITITVNPKLTPVFTQVAPICQGGTFVLPATSSNGVSGTWSPAINNQETKTYTFTPSAGQCVSATPVTMTVVVNPKLTPVFTQVAPICQDGTFVLPATSSVSGDK